MLYRTAESDLNLPITVYGKDSEGEIYEPFTITWSFNSGSGYSGTTTTAQTATAVFDPEEALGYKLELEITVTVEEGKPVKLYSDEDCSTEISAVAANPTVGDADSTLADIVELYETVYAKPDIVQEGETGWPVRIGITWSCTDEGGYKPDTVGAYSVVAAYNDEDAALASLPLGYKLPDSFSLTGTVTVKAAE